MTAREPVASELARALLAERIGEADLLWLDEAAPLAAQGIGSLDLISVLARIQREAGLALPDDFTIDAETSLAAVVGSLRPRRRLAHAEA
jgi:acyl carrier protein